MNDTSDLSCPPLSPQNGPPESLSALERAIQQALGGSARAERDETESQRALTSALEHDTDAARAARARLLRALAAGQENIFLHDDPTPALGASAAQIPPMLLPML